MLAPRNQLIWTELISWMLGIRRRGSELQRNGDVEYQAYRMRVDYYSALSGVLAQRIRRLAIGIDGYE